MRRWDIALSLAAAVLAARSANAPARADDTTALTCESRRGSFVLDDTDFAALAAAGVSRERFLSLAMDSRDRRAVCDTRMLSRLIKSGAADACDFDRYDVVTKYFDKSELRAALDSLTRRHAGKCPQGDNRFLVEAIVALALFPDHAHSALTRRAAASISPPMIRPMTIAATMRRRRVTARARVRV